jgi:cytochrome c2
MHNTLNTTEENELLEGIVEMCSYWITIGTKQIRGTSMEFAKTAMRDTVNRIIVYAHKDYGCDC